jgi:hypothetical protein
MNHRVMFASLFLVVFVCSVATAGPILKPRKYHGPIPRSSITLRGGFMGGATNEEMFEFLDSKLAPPFEAYSNDFGTAPFGEIAYTYKLHPQFAVRGTLSFTYLKADGDGFFVPPVGELPDSVLAPQLDYSREFTVELFTVEGSAIYYFTDASIKEFQPYVGAGLSLGIPHQQFEETQVVSSETDEYFTKGEVFKEISESKWSAEAGVHAVLGALYYFGNRWAGTIEGRVQMLQSKFSLETQNETGEYEDVSFDVKYNGFTLALGVSYAF